MTSPGGFLDFFVFEAGELLEQLDGVLAGGETSPDIEALQRSARALRGSATMAKLPAFAGLAAAVERVARGLKDGGIAWDAALRGAMVSAVDDLKALLHGVRAWGAAEDERAKARAAELARWAPERAATPSASMTSGASFFGGEASNIAAGLELLVTRPNDREGAANVLRRVRALRGVAGIKELAPLPDLMEAAEMAARRLEADGEPLEPQALALLRATSSLLRRVASSLREGRPGDIGTEERDEFVAAMEGFHDAEANRERILPVSELFFDDDGPHVVEQAQNPPTRPSDRFRLELVSQGEHLRGLLDDARRAADDTARARIGRELRRTLISLRTLAVSFGERDIASIIGEQVATAASLDYLTLSSLNAIADVLAEPGPDSERLARRIADIRTDRAMDQGIAAGLMGDMGNLAPLARGETRLSAALRAVPDDVAPPHAAPAPHAASPAAAVPHVPATPAPAPAPAPVAPPAPTLAPTPAYGQPVFTPAVPTPVAPAAPMHLEPFPAMPSMPGTAAAESMHTPPRSATPLDNAIAGLDMIATRPLATPGALPELAPIPIENLLYRGRAALDRAIQIRDQMRQAGGTPAVEDLEELFDLLELARAS